MSNTRLTYKYKLRKKTDSWFQRLLGVVVWPFNRRFVKDYWTTIHDTIYVPSVYDDDSNWGTPTWRAKHFSILEHESIHVRQWEEEGWLHDIKYLGPAVIPLALLLFSIPFAIFFPRTLFWPGMVLSILTVLLSPLSIGLAYWRWEKEFEAGLPSLIRWAHRDRRRYEQVLAHRVKMLWWEYLFTWPPSWMEKRFRAAVERAIHQQ